MKGALGMLRWGRGSKTARLARSRWIAGCAALAALLAVSSALANAQVQVKTDGPMIQVTATIGTTVDRQTAWDVLTDYNHWADFVPNMQLSRVISPPGQPLRVEQRGAVPWLPNFPLVVVAQVEETPQRMIRFRRLAGNVRVLDGEWQIQGEKPVRLLYRSTVELGFPLPAQISAEIFSSDAKVRLEAMAREMARRAAAGEGSK
jgi:hypothetical protein